MQGAERDQRNVLWSDSLTFWQGGSYRRVCIHKCFTVSHHCISNSLHCITYFVFQLWGQASVVSHLLPLLTLPVLRSIEVLGWLVHIGVIPVTETVYASPH